MDLQPLTPVLLLCLGAAVLTLSLLWMQRRGWVDMNKDRVRRGTGHAMLGLQEFVEPSVEYVFQAENVELKEEDDLGAEGGNSEAIKHDLAASLGRSPIDPEEIRRYLAEATRAGLSWRDAYDAAVRSELEARPFKAPSIPPAWKVAPRERLSE
jgi:hypothetical protein